MKRLSNVLVLILCCATTLHPEKNTNALSAQYVALPLIHDLQMQQQTSLHRLYILPAIVSTIALTQINHIGSFFKNHPFASAALLYLLSNMAIDGYSKYQKIHYTLQVLCFAQKIHYYVLCLSAVNNKMIQFAQQTNSIFQQQQFLHTIKKYAKHDMDDLQEFTQILIRNSLLFVHDLCLNPYIDTINQQLHDFSVQTISIDQLLSISEHDQAFYAELETFNHDPENHVEKIIAIIGTKIDQNLQQFFTHISMLNQCAISKENI